MVGYDEIAQRVWKRNQSIDLNPFLCASVWVVSYCIALLQYAMVSLILGLY